VNFLLGMAWNCDPPDLSLPCSWNESIPLAPNYSLRWGLANFLSGMAWNQDSPNMILPSSEDYRIEPLVPGQNELS
jgi:hypothetical protein